MFVCLPRLSQHRRLSHPGLVSKRLNVSTPQGSHAILDFSVSNLMAMFRQESPITGASNGAMV